MKHHNQDIVLIQNENSKYNSDQRRWLLFIDRTDRSEDQERITLYHIKDTNIDDYEKMKWQDREIEGHHLFELTDAELARQLKNGELKLR